MYNEQPKPEPDWVKQRRKNYDEQMERQRRHPPDEDEWNK